MFIEFHPLIKPTKCTSHSDSSVGYYSWRWDSSSLPHIIASAFSSIADLWQMTTFSSYVFFVMVHCHFVAMGPLCIGFSPFYFLNFSSLFAFVFFFGLCLYVLSFVLYF
jgi:hypothetical protein